MAIEMLLDFGSLYPTVVMEHQRFLESWLSAQKPCKAGSCRLDWAGGSQAAVRPALCPAPVAPGRAFAASSDHAASREDSSCPWLSVDVLVKGVLAPGPHCRF